MVNFCIFFFSLTVICINFDKFISPTTFERRVKSRLQFKPMITVLALIRLLSSIAECIMKTTHPMTALS